VPPAAGDRTPLHREARAEQADAGDAGGRERIGGAIGDVQQRQRRGLGDRVCDLVHGVGAQHDEIGATCLQRTRRRGHGLTGGIPVAGVLQRFDLVEIHAVQQQPGRMQAAERVAHGLVDDPVVEQGGFPAHAADQANGLHRVNVLHSSCT